ncbi:MAG: 23S rRNA (adenine(2503)-C(2))-methyltransferase RlmN [Thermoleophilia bacterium]
MIDPQTIAAVVADLGAPPYRTRQIYRALTRDLVTEFAEITTLPTDLRATLSTRLRPASLTPSLHQKSEDSKTQKTLFHTHDGLAVEAVLIRSGARATVCISTQVGCAVGCAFCASGRTGLRRGLSAEEMVDQVLHYARTLRDLSSGHITNVVFMGMGEPFHNYEETLRACRLLNDPDGFHLAARAMSLSTAGVVPGIERLAGEPLQLNLAVSLHAGTDALRDSLVPLNHTYPLDAVFAACERYVMRTNRKVMFEYVVLPGVNDTAVQMDALTQRLRAPLYHLNLIAYNETGERFARPSHAHLLRLCARFLDAGVSCTVRHSPGRGIEAACGQLARRELISDTSVRAENSPRA